MTDRADLDRQVDDGRADLARLSREIEILEGKKRIALGKVLAARREITALERREAGGPDLVSSPPDVSPEITSKV